MTRSFPRASNATDLAPVAVFDMTVPNFTGPNWEKTAREWYADRAIEMTELLTECAPQGFVDALLAQLCLRKATLLRCR